MYCKLVNWIVSLIAAIGAINWGLVAFFKFNLVAYVDSLMGNVGADKAIYAVVALAGVYALITLFTFKS